jgi:hypothetical protein
MRRMPMDEGKAFSSMAVSDAGKAACSSGSDFQCSFLKTQISETGHTGKCAISNSRTLPGILMLDSDGASPNQRWLSNLNQ